MTSNCKKFSYKNYENYEEYITHQSSKLEDRKDFINNFTLNYKNFLYDELKNINFIFPSMSVLCLGARLGAEVEAFIKLKCFAVGIDLNPGKNNRYVLKGDFHNIQFADNSIDIIFCNSIDHILNIEKFVNEIYRTLKIGGFLILDIPSKESVDNDEWASFNWEKTEDIISFFEKKLKCIMKNKINFLWFTDRIVFKNEINNNIFPK